MKNTWQLQKAKNQLSQVLDMAITKGPQFITRHNEEEAVILSIADFKKLTRPQDSLADFFKKSPLRGIELNLERSRDTARDIDL